MMIRWNRFNIYFVACLAVMLLCGCQSAERKRSKEFSVLHFHIETNPDPTGHTERIAIGPEHSVGLDVQKQPFLTEANIKQAKMMDVIGGFAVSIQLDRQGTWLLEEYTGANRGNHLALFCKWTVPPDKKLNNGRWLAAPEIRTRISDGLLVFTPDATREEAEQIVFGLNNVAKRIDKEVTNRW